MAITPLNLVLTLGLLVLVIGRPKVTTISTDSEGLKSLPEDIHLSERAGWTRRSLIVCDDGYVNWDLYGPARPGRCFISYTDVPSAWEWEPSDNWLRLFEILEVLSVAPVILFLAFMAWHIWLN